MIIAKDSDNIPRLLRVDATGKLEINIEG